MATKINYYTDTPLDTVFRDKLFGMASDCICLAGMKEGKFTVVDILPEEQLKKGCPVFGQMEFQFTWLDKCDTCNIYPARFSTLQEAKDVCRYSDKTEARKSFRSFKVPVA